MEAVMASIFLINLIILSNVLILFGHDLHRFSTHLFQKNGFVVFHRLGGIFIKMSDSI